MMSITLQVSYLVNERLEHGGFALRPKSVRAPGERYGQAACSIPASESPISPGQAATLGGVIRAKSLQDNFESVVYVYAGLHLTGWSVRHWLQLHDSHCAKPRDS